MRPYIIYDDDEDYVLENLASPDDDFITQPENTHEPEKPDMTFENDYHEMLNRVCKKVEYRKENNNADATLSMVNIEPGETTFIGNYSEMCVGRDEEHFISFACYYFKSDCFIDRERGIVFEKYISKVRVINMIKKYISEFIECKKCEATKTTMSNSMTECTMCGEQKKLKYVLD